MYIYFTTLNVKLKVPKMLVYLYFFCLPHKAAICYFLVVQSKLSSLEIQRATRGVGQRLFELNFS